MGSSEFETSFLEKFNGMSSDHCPGEAGLTRIERVGLKRLLEETGSKELAVKLIIENGYPFVREEVTAEDLGETAYEHICVVAAHLNRTRGEEAAPDTVESYITKNRFDRWLQLNLIRKGKFSGKLEEEWFSPQQRQLGFNNSQIEYPTGVDSTKIYGIAKPHRYWPAQTMRYLEFIRLGKVKDPGEKEKLGVVEGEEYLYKITWDNFVSVLEEENTLEGIAAGIAVKTISILKERGLADERVAKLILAGYSPGGPMKEHGNTPQVHELWRDIIDRVQKRPDLASMRRLLIGGVSEKMKSVDSSYEFRYKMNTE